MAQASQTDRQLFIYDHGDFTESIVPSGSNQLFDTSKEVSWFNQNGAIDPHELNAIISHYGFDEFLRILFIEEEQRNKVIDLEESLYLSINVLLHENDKIQYDMIRLYFQPGLVWTVQEKEGDYFDGVREFIRENKGIIRRKKADYLLFKLLEAIVDNYWKAYESYSEDLGALIDVKKLQPDLSFVRELENRKNKLISIRTAVIKLRDTLTQLSNWEYKEFGNHYFILLCEQTKDLIEEVNADLELQESNLNLAFNLQNHRLNEIMKTLTIFSVIFIPLTFMAGIYGMNFENMPELKHPSGYFILLGVMLAVTVLSLFIIKRRKWF